MRRIRPQSAGARSSLIELPHRDGDIHVAGRRVDEDLAQLPFIAAVERVEEVQHGGVRERTAGGVLEQVGLVRVREDLDVPLDAKSMVTAFGLWDQRIGAGKG